MTFLSLFFFVFFVFFFHLVTHSLVEAGWGRRDAWNIFFFFITLTSFSFFFCLSFFSSLLLHSIRTSNTLPLSHNKQTSSSIIFLLHTENLITQFDSLLYFIFVLWTLLLHRLDQSRHRDSIYDFSFLFIFIQRAEMLHPQTFTRIANFAPRQVFFALSGALITFLTMLFLSSAGCFFSCSLREPPNLWCPRVRYT